MRVLILLGAFPVVSETFILHQITGLIDRGHDVRIVAQQRLDPGSDAMHEDVRRYGLDAATISLLPPESGLGEPESILKVVNRKLATARHLVPGAAATVVRRPAQAVRAFRPAAPSPLARPSSPLQRLYLLRHARELAPDVMHAHFGYVALEYLHATETFRVPFIVSFHGYDFSAFPRLHGQHVYAELFARATLVTANAENTRRRLIDLGCPAYKIRVLLCGIPVHSIPYRPRLPRPDEPLRIISVGRLSGKKGLQYAIEALPAIADRSPGLSYAIIGDGPLRTQLAETARRLQVDDLITFYGARDTVFVQEMLAKAHIFVLPSVTPEDGDEEGRPLAIQEAFAAGLPVVSTNHGGIPELVQDGVTGMLVPERDPHALAQAVLRLADHPENWRSMTDTARAYVEATHDIDRLNDELVRIYDEARAVFTESPGQTELVDAETLETSSAVSDVET
jgi:colanic acid/amylovoran biosynthesis glycosyltransferase